jgi:hypothetical protein
MIPTCTFFKRTENLKAFMHTRLARQGEGAGLSKVRGAKKMARTESRVEKRKDSLEAERENMREAGLYICDERCATTKMYCKKIYQSQNEFDKYCNHKHKFPKGQNVRDCLLRESSKPGGIVQAGSRPDRQSNQLFETIVASEEGSFGDVAARCLGRYNRKEASKGYRKPEKLVEALEMLYAIEPKLGADEMRERMKMMRDTDGGLLFCWEKRTTIGMLLSTDQIQGWITSRTQKKKNDERGTLTEKQQEESQLINQLQNGENQASAAVSATVS